MNTHNLNLDLDKVRGAGRVVPVSATDRRGTTLAVSVTDGGAPCPLAGCSVSLAARLASGAAVSVPCSVDGSTATVTLDEAILAGLPASPTYLTIQKDGATYSTSRFTIKTMEGVPR